MRDGRRDGAGVWPYQARPIYLYTQTAIIADLAVWFGK